MRLIYAIVTAGAVVALSACGSTSAVAPAGSGGGSGGGTPVQLDAASSAFEPSTIAVKPGDRVTVTLNNRDSYEHNFSISELNVSKDVEGKGTGSVTFTATSSNLQFFCKYHRAKGMVGTISVGGSGASPAPATTTPAASGSGSIYGY